MVIHERSQGIPRVDQRHLSQRAHQRVRARAEAGDHRKACSKCAAISSWARSRRASRAACPRRRHGADGWGNPAAAITGADVVPPRIRQREDFFTKSHNRNVGTRFSSRGLNESNRRSVKAGGQEDAGRLRRIADAAWRLFRRHWRSDRCRAVAEQPWSVQAFTEARHAAGGGSRGRAARITHRNAGNLS